MCEWVILITELFLEDNRPIRFNELVVKSPQYIHHWFQNPN